MSNVKDPRITIWADKDRVTVYVGGDGLHSTLSLSPKAATRLALELSEKVETLPRVATAEDLGVAA